MNNALANLRSALVAFYRTSARHPLYTALNVLGLAFGIAVFIIVSLYVRYELTYDRWLPNTDNIYQICTTRLLQQSRRECLSNGITLEVIRAAFPKISGTRVSLRYAAIRRGAEVIEEQIQVVDPDIFKVLNLPPLHGKAGTVLTPGEVVLSEAMALKYFGRTEVVGQHLAMTDMKTPINSSPTLPVTYRVAAVLKTPPANTSLKFEIVRLFNASDRAEEGSTWTEWGNTSWRTFLRLETREEAKTLNARLDGIVDGNGTSMRARDFGLQNHEVHQLRAVRLWDEHLNDARTRAFVLAMAAIALLVLAIALINYINLVTAMAGLRVREVTLRKVSGASSGRLRLQFLGETFFLTIMSLFAGLSCVEVILPVLKLWTGVSLSLNYVRDASLVALLTASVVSASLLAGLYPSGVLVALKPVASLPSAVADRIQTHVRGGLVVIQFAIVATGLILAAGFATQVRHMETSDLGFERTRLLFTFSTVNAQISDAEVERVFDAWRALPGVEAVGFGLIPGRHYRNGALPFARLDKPILAGLEPNSVDEDFFRAYGISLIAGRMLSAADQVGREKMPIGNLAEFNIVVSRNAARHLQFVTPQEAVGKYVKFGQSRFYIVGVVGDLRLDAPEKPPPASLYLLGDWVRGDSGAILRYHGGDEDLFRAKLTAEWKRHLPNMPIDLFSGREALDYYYENSRRHTQLMSVSVGVAALVGIIGLYGLAAFSTSARTFEIGLRKAMGATRWSVVRLLLFQILKPVLLANLIAWPVAYVVLDRWLKQFDDRVAMNVWFFAAGSGISLLVAVLTVGGLAFTAAGTSPSKALRHE